MAPLLATFENTANVPQVVHHVGKNDVVERVVEIDVFDAAFDELKLGMALARFVDHLFGEVDTDAFGRRERGEKIAVAAPELEHCFSRGNEESVDISEPAVVRRAAAVRARGLVPDPAVLVDEALARRG